MAHKLHNISTLSGEAAVQHIEQVYRLPGTRSDPQLILSSVLEQET